MTKSPRLLLRFIIVLLLGSALLVLYTARNDLKPHVTRMLAGEGKWFTEQTPPIPSMPHIFGPQLVSRQR